MLLVNLDPTLMNKPSVDLETGKTVYGGLLHYLHEGVSLGIFPPLIFLGILFLVHSILGVFSKKDSQIAQIILSTINIFTKKIPKRLNV